jgi:phosphate transport system substrate-binding protein
MLLLTQALADEYMKLNPGIAVYVEGGGTASGIKSLINGEIHICTASRTLKPDEVKLLADKFNSIGMATIIARDALSIFINDKNPVKNFTLNEVKEIFTGKILNWKFIGGDDRPIVAVIRNPNSGTFLYFKEHILNGEEYSSSAITESTTEKIITFIKNDKYAISYGGIGYGESKYHATINDVQPTEENVRKDLYPIARYLHFYTLVQPEGVIKNFIDWVLSPAGQKIVKQTGFIPLYERTF